MKKIWKSFLNEFHAYVSHQPTSQPNRICHFWYIWTEESKKLKWKISHSDSANVFWFCVFSFFVFLFSFDINISISNDKRRCDTRCVSVQFIFLFCTWIIDETSFFLSSMMMNKYGWKGFIREIFLGMFFLFPSRKIIQKKNYRKLFSAKKNLIIFFSENSFSNFFSTLTVNLSRIFSPSSSLSLYIEEENENFPEKIP